MTDLREWLELYAVEIARAQVEITYLIEILEDFHPMQKDVQKVLQSMKQAYGDLQFLIKESSAPPRE